MASRLASNRVEEVRRETAEIAEEVSKIFRRHGKDHGMEAAAGHIDRLFLRAVKDGDVERAKLLVRAWGANPNSYYENGEGEGARKGMRALHLVAVAPNINNREELTEMLICLPNIDMNAYLEGRTPLDLAESAGNHEVAGLLRRAGETGWIEHRYKVSSARSIYKLQGTPSD